jgi:hypothetical protein
MHTQSIVFLAGFCRLHARQSWSVSAANCLCHFWRDSIGLLHRRATTASHLPRNETIFLSNLPGTAHWIRDWLNQCSAHTHGSVLNEKLRCLQRSVISPVSTLGWLFYLAFCSVFRHGKTLFFPAAHIIIGWAGARQAQQQSTSFSSCECKCERANSNCRMHERGRIFPHAIRVE